MPRLADLIDQNLIKDCEIVICDNVAHFFFDGKDPEGWRSSDFPNIAPPFNAMYLEWKIPINLVGKRIRGEYSAVIMHASEIEESITLFDGDDAIVDAKWIIECNVLWKNEHSEKWRIDLMPYFLIPVSEDGSFCGRVLDYKNPLIHIEAGFVQESALRWFIYPALLALSFMHCKNVELKTTIPPVPLSKKYQKKTGRPLVRYKILEIEPMKKVLRTEGQSETLSLKHALHICRGHFKDYSKGGGLFGKYKGFYWWESYVRGDPDQGVVVKDYNVKPPSETPS
jgi:hypothetical protein